MSLSMQNLIQNYSFKDTHLNICNLTKLRQTIFYTYSYKLQIIQHFIRFSWEPMNWFDKELVSIFFNSHLNLEI